MGGREVLKLPPGRHVGEPRPHRGHRAPVVRSDAGLSVSGVHKRFRETEVLRRVNLEVARGEVVALLGKNGAGKSTLLRILVGIIIPDGGEIAIGGYDLRRDPVAARGEISWVLGDEHGWYWRLTGLQNLTFFAMLRGLGRREAGIRAAAEIRRQGLQAAADTRVGEYSTGMRARLALARASLVPTAAMVLDEPGRGLDAAANEWLVEHLGSLTNTAVLLVTHDLEMVSRVASRSMILAAGTVREQLAARTPASTLAARIAEATPR